LTSEVLRLTNSSYLGAARNVTDPAEAVDSLGLETVKAVVMALQYLAEHSRLKPPYLSLGQIWQHSINVGLIARDLVLFETKDQTLAAQALTAGLLHDLGKVVLAKNFDDLYARVYSLARKQPVAIWDIEKEMFGANHGEIGGCLLGMWNMPFPIVEATALHHEPPVGEHDELTPLAAIHIANVLERELQPHDDELQVAPIINTPFLNQLGLLHRLPIWRAALANRRPLDSETDVESAETPQAGWVVPSSTTRSRGGNQLPGLAGSRSITSRRSRSGGGTPSVRTERLPRSWIYAGAAGVVLLMTLWFTRQPEPSRVELAYARTPVAPQTAFSSVPAVETAPVKAAAAISDEPPAPPVHSEPVAKPVTSPSESQPSVATVSNIPPASVAPEKKARPDFRLNGIIYTSDHPSAIVNGQRVNPGDQVDGATVLTITPTTLTLQFNGQRKVFVLR